MRRPTLAEPEVTVLDEGTPLFLQIAEQLSADIVDGTLAEGSRVPSTNEFAAFYRINPATAAKGINVLVDSGVLEKRRGIGMFVVSGARKRLIELRRRQFADQFIEPMVAEARLLGMDTNELIELIGRQSEQRSTDQPIDSSLEKGAAS
jgi:GntR family transcriptional regulator